MSSITFQRAMAESAVQPWRALIFFPSW